MKRVIMISLLSLLLIGIIGGSVSASKLFNDIDSVDWYYENIDVLVDEGIIKGYPNGEFGPYDEMTVDQFIKTMVVALGYDLQNGKDYWARPFIDKATQLNIVKTGDFKTYNTPITRAEMARIAVRVVEMLEGEKEYSMPIQISNTVADNYSIELTGLKNDIYHVYELGIITGYPDGEFKPYNVLNRSEACTVVRRVIDKSVRQPFEYVNEDVGRLESYDYNENNLFKDNEEYVAKYGLSDTTEYMDLIKEFVELDFNINYKTLNGTAFKQQYRYYFNPSSTYSYGKTSEEMIDEWIQEIRDKKIILEGTFETDSSLVYLGSDGSVRVRGVITYIYRSHEDFNIPNIEVGKRYKCDTEVVFSRSLDKPEYKNLWIHSELTYDRYIWLGDDIEVGE